MKCDFQVGDEVICINDDYSNWNASQLKYMPNRPIKDQKYTIRYVYYTGQGLVKIHLNELKNIPRTWNTGYREAGFNYTRFRKVIKKKTDISIFTDMLKTKELETL